MRWFLTCASAALLTLVASSLAQACGCCGCCQSGGGSCPSCPKQAAGGTCPNCPHPASYGPYRYWSSAYACELLYDPATSASYYWSGADRRYYPVSDTSTPAPVSPSAAAPSAHSAPVVYATRYFNPD